MEADIPSSARTELSVSEQAKTAEQEALKEEIRRRSALLEKKESAYAAQSKLLEAAEQKIRELVRSEGEADYRSRTLSAKLTSAEKALKEATDLKRTLERNYNKAQQEADKLRFELESTSQKLASLQDLRESRDVTSDQLEHKNRDLESKLSRMTGKVELYRGKIESLQRQISDKDTETALVQQKLELSMLSFRPIVMALMVRGVRKRKCPALRMFKISRTS